MDSYVNYATRHCAQVDERRRMRRRLLRQFLQQLRGVCLAVLLAAQRGQVLPRRAATATEAGRRTGQGGGNYEKHGEIGGKRMKKGVAWIVKFNVKHVQEPTRNLEFHPR